MNNYNSVNSISLGKLLNKYNLTPRNKQKAILFAKRKTVTRSGLVKLLRKLKFKQSAENQELLN